jgi:hypothetical protein
MSSTNPCPEGHAWQVYRWLMAVARWPMNSSIPFEIKNGWVLKTQVRKLKLIVVGMI